MTGDVALWTKADGVAGVQTFKGVPAGWFALPNEQFIAGVANTNTTATNLLAVNGSTPSVKP